LISTNVIAADGDAGTLAIANTAGNGSSVNLSKTAVRVSDHIRQKEEFVASA